MESKLKKTFNTSIQLLYPRRSKESKQRKKISTEDYLDTPELIICGWIYRFAWNCPILVLTILDFPAH